MSSDEWMLASASERVMADRPRRKLTASEPSKIQAVESRYAHPYLENAPLPPNIGAKQREAMIKLRAQVNAKLDFATIASRKLTEATEAYEQILSQHTEANHPATDDCTETLQKLEEAYSRLHDRFVREYRELGELAKQLYSGR